MRREKLFFLAAVIITGGFLFSVSASSEEECATSSGWSSIKINEVSSYSSSDDWVELHNFLGMCVRLDGLKLWDSGVSSAMRVLTGDIFAEGFLIVNAGNRLGRDGDSVILKDGDSELDRFDYGTSEFPAPKENEVWAREIDGLGAWKISVRETPGLANIIELSSSTPPIDPPTTTPPVDPPTTTPTSTPPIDPPTTTPTSTPPTDPPTTTPTSSPVIDWATIKINEFVSNPTSGNEWVELYNLSSDDVDLVGAVICDNRITGCKNLSGTILANSWFYYDLLTASFLNNDGDSVVLKDPESNIIDQFDYDSSCAPKKGESFARSVDGLGNFTLTTQITPGEANVIVAPIPASSGGGSTAQNPINTEETTTEPIICEEQNIFINELYPNPFGSDTEEEFIEIINLTSSTINLDGWKLADLSQSFKLTGEIKPDEILFWKRPETKIALNNTSKETVKLIDVNKCEIDAISYDKAGEAESYARADDGAYAWTSSPSPGEKNIFSQKDSGIVWKIRYPLHGIAGEIITFDAEDSADERGGEIIFEWDFGTATSSGAIVSKVFFNHGDHQVKVSASSTSGSRGKKIIDISINALAVSDPSDISISEIFANPSGTDAKEFIEIFNSGENEIDLTGWILRASAGSPFVFATGTKIDANKYLVFYKTATKISINNTEDKISLIDNNKRLIDMVRIGKSKTDQSYALVNEEWKWSGPSPGGPNIAVLALASSASVSNKKFTTYPLVAIETARQMDKDDGVKTRGAVVALPQMFGKQYFYIFDGKSGIQIYQYQGKFPALKFGDLVEVKGILSEASGVKRIKLKDERAIDILAIEKEISPIKTEITGLGEEDLGALVEVEGEITSKKTNYIYVDDGGGEIKVYFKQNAKIDKSVLDVGGKIKVVGLLEISAGEMTILPRQTSDLVFEDASLAGAMVEGAEPEQEKSAKEIAEKYLTATAGGLTALILGFLGRARGVAVLGLIKKVASKIIFRV